MSHRHLIGRGGPPLRRIVVVLAAMLALPVSSYLSGSKVGSHRMFSDPMEYQIALYGLDRDGARRPIPLAALGPHLGLDARRVILPAARPTFGDTAASLLSGGLRDLAELACAISPAHERVSALLTRQTVSAPLPPTRAEVDCAAFRSTR